MVTEPDTVLKIRDGRVAHSFVSLSGFNYYLDLYEDNSIYELSMSLDPGASDVHITWPVSWGDYKVRGNRILFSDRIAGFKMEASLEPGVGMKFLRDYLPQINEKALCPRSIWQDCSRFLLNFLYSRENENMDHRSDSTR